MTSSGHDEEPGLAGQDDAPDVLGERLVHAYKLAVLGDLSAGVAHEINNPLAVIRQEAELLLDLLPENVLGNVPDGAEVRDSLTEIIRQVDRCKAVTHNLLSFARKSEPVFQIVDVNALVEDMVVLMDNEAGYRGITIQRAYAADLPMIRTDAPQLRQVVLNLLNNGVQSIADAGEVHVQTGMADAKNVFISIRDNGCGIAPDIVDKIFNPFFTTNDPGKGIGLGLSTSENIVSRLGGAITVESQMHQGSTFTITLPVARTR